MPRTPGATNRKPRRVLVAARLPEEIAAYLRPNVTEKLEQILEEHMRSNRIYTAWMSNEQGASTDVTGRFTSLNEIRRVIRAQFGPGWTAHIQARDIDGDGQSVLMHGDSPIYEVETFTLRK